MGSSERIAYFTENTTSLRHLKGNYYLHTKKNNSTWYNHSLVEVREGTPIKIGEFDYSGDPENMGDASMPWKLPLSKRGDEQFQLSNSTVIYTKPRISKDGRYFSYLKNESILYVMDLEKGGEPQEIPLGITSVDYDFNPYANVIYAHEGMKPIS